jgi:ketosteroid isomerase-like protein
MHVSNGALIHKAYQDFAHGDVASVFGVLDPAITWHIPGHGPLSGDFTGHEEIGAFLRRTMELSGGSFRIDVERVLADGEIVVALVTVNARRNGTAASFPEVHVWRVTDGRVTAFREYQGDEQREDRFWACGARSPFVLLALRGPCSAQQLLRNVAAVGGELH